MYSQITLGSNVEVHRQLLVLFVELLSDTLADLANLTVLTVILNAVLEDQVHVVEEVLELQILIRVQLLLYRTEIHWLLNDLEVVRDVQLLRVNRFKEDPSLLQLHENSHNSLCSFIPRIVDRCLV